MPLLMGLSILQWFSIVEAAASAEPAIVNAVKSVMPALAPLLHSIGNAVDNVKSKGVDHEHAVHSVAGMLFHRVADEDLWMKRASDSGAGS